MKLQVFVIFLYLFIISTMMTGASAKKTAVSVKTTSCRLHKGISRCVDNPIKKRHLPTRLRGKKKQRFCPYHICGPSYIPTKECPLNGLPPATGKCNVRTIRPWLWVCRERLGKPMKYLVNFPFGCRGKSATRCRSRVYVCSCFRRRVSQQKLKHILDYTPDCKA